MCPQNKKDYHMYMYTLRHIARDVDSPERLKADIYKQCEDFLTSKLALASLEVKKLILIAV